MVSPLRLFDIDHEGLRFGYHRIRIAYRRRQEIGALAAAAVGRELPSEMPRYTYLMDRRVHDLERLEPVGYNQQ